VYYGKEQGLALKKQARITSKGQITVPREIRRALGVGPGDRLLFEKGARGVSVRPVRMKSPFFSSALTRKNVATGC
jgi:AbrB family looped-hinge helix DNA binding protein